MLSRKGMWTTPTELNTFVKSQIFFISLPINFVKCLFLNAIILLAEH